MGLIYVENFDGGTAGDVVAGTSNSSFSLMSGTNPWTFSTTGERSGSLAGRCSSSAANQYGQWTLPGSTSTTFMRFYFTMSSGPSGVVGIVQGASNGSQRWRLQLNTSGQVQITNNNTVVATSSANVCNGQMWRIEVEVTGSAITCRIYGGANLETTTPTQTLTGTYNSGTFNQIRMGSVTNVSAVPVTYYVDDIAGDDASTPGPAAAVPVFLWREWTGSAETALTMAGEWNGTTIVPLSPTITVV